MENREPLPFLPVGKIGLRKTLNVWHILALAVGLVISGEYFGWNYGWGVAGTVGFTISTVIVTITYAAFIFSYTELTCMLPHAGGPYAYAYRAWGPIGGMIAGYATLMEFIFAAPAIAVALGSYMNFLSPVIPIIPSAVVFYIIFTLINIRGVKGSAVLGIIVTIAAVIELVVLLLYLLPHAHYCNFVQDEMHLGFNWGSKQTWGNFNAWGSVIAGLPFAVWFYLGIEGVAMVSEEVKDTQKTLSRGYIGGILILTVLVFGVMFIAGGLPNWHDLVEKIGADGKFHPVDNPLPEAVASVSGENHAMSKIFAFLGVCGLIASFHAIILSYSRQIFALSRGNYLPRFLSKINSKYQTPHWALIVGGVIGIISILNGKKGTEILVVLSVLGAVVMYIISMLSLFKLRKKEPNLKRPFKTPGYPLVPILALFLSLLCLGAIIKNNFDLSLGFFCGLLFFLIIFIAFKGHKKTDRESFDTGG